MSPIRKIPKTFISFLIISVFIWLLITFSREYVTVITVPVTYKNIPQNRLLQKTPIKHIDISVKATGFKIIRSKLKNTTINLEANKLQRKHTSKFFILPKNQTSKIQKQLLSEIEIQEVLQDTIFLNIGVLASKKVRLQPALNINYHIGYDLLEDIKIQPDSIIISGSESHLKEIDYLETSILQLNKVKGNFEKSVQILKPDAKKNLKLSQQEATVIGKVDKFTEGVLKVPYIINNLPKNTNLTILTESVDVMYVIALSNFSKISEASFTVECDFEMSQKNNLTYLIPKVVGMPDFVKSYRVFPTKIDFLIQK